MAFSVAKSIIIVDVWFSRFESVRDGERTLLVKCATMTMYDIPSCEKSGQTVGSLIFSESFLDSVLRVKHEGK